MRRRAAARRRARSSRRARRPLVPSAARAPRRPRLRRPSPTPLPTFDRTATPATTSGSLRRASLPRAAVLGAGWTSRVDPGATEDGYTGNGTPSVARDPQDTVVALRPIGCAEESVYAEPLPVPRHALEVDYRHRPTGANGVGLALEFADAAAAGDFFDVYTALARALPRPVPGARRGSPCRRRRGPTRSPP